MARSLSTERDASKARCARLVVLPDVQRMLAGVKAGFAGFDFAVVLVGLADLELKAATLEVLIEALESDDALGFGPFSFSFGHGFSPSVGFGWCGRGRLGRAGWS